MASRDNAAVKETALCASTKTFCKSGFIRTSFDFSIFVFEYSLLIFKLAVIHEGNEGFGAAFKYLTYCNFVSTSDNNEKL